MTQCTADFEAHILHTGGNNGNIEVKLFNGDSTTPTETVAVTNTTIRTGMDTFHFGSGALNTTHWLDDLVMGATSYPGPVLAPPAYASALQQVPPIVRGGFS